MPCCIRIAVSHDLLKQVPWADFDRLVQRHRADARVRRLPTKSQFIAMLYGQLAGAASLRDSVEGMASQPARLYHLGAKLPKRSTLSDANALRPSAPFAELLALMIARSHRGLRRSLAETTCYYDYAWWKKLDEAGCRIVTRLKSNTKLAVIEELPIPPQGPPGTNILSDRIGHLPRRLSNSRDNPFHDAVREVRVTLDTGKVLRILSNDLDAPATEIALLYKRRWAIELFFRWVKQVLKIRRFLGTSENAVAIQIAGALIAFLLLGLAQAAQKTITSPLAFARLVRANLMHRRRLDRLLDSEPPPILNPNQLALQWNLT